MAELDEAFGVIQLANEPSVLPAGKFDRLFEIARLLYRDPRGAEHPLLTPDEVRFLSISQGSLDSSEREQIESHVVHSFNFLMQIPWTKEIRHIPAIARAHHEKLNGTGYPYRLKGVEIPVQARMMTICDIFDALSAADRPYKKAVPAERALAILETAVRESGARSGVVQAVPRCENISTFPAAVLICRRFGARCAGSQRCDERDAKTLCFVRRVAVLLLAAACVACIPFGRWTRRAAESLPNCRRRAAQHRPAPGIGFRRARYTFCAGYCGAARPGCCSRNGGRRETSHRCDGTRGIQCARRAGQICRARRGENDCSVAPAVPASDPAPDASASVQLTSSPRVLEVRNRFELAGIGFRGSADDNHIAIGEKQALVLAASPTSIVAMPDPATVLGAGVLSVGVANQAAAATVAVIVVTLDAIRPQGALRVGQQTTLTVRVRGTTEPLAIEVSNLSPAILQLPGGNPLKVTFERRSEQRSAISSCAAGAGKVFDSRAPHGE